MTSGVQAVVAGGYHTYEKLGFQKSAREAWARAIETCRDATRKQAMQARLAKLLRG